MFNPFTFGKHYRIVRKIDRYGEQYVTQSWQGIFGWAFESSKWTLVDAKIHLDWMKQQKQNAKVDDVVWKDW